MASDQGSDEQCCFVTEKSLSTTRYHVRLPLERYASSSSSFLSLQEPARTNVEQWCNMQVHVTAAVAHHRQLGEALHVQCSVRDPHPLGRSRGA